MSGRGRQTCREVSREEGRPRVRDQAKAGARQGARPQDIRHTQGMQVQYMYCMCIHSIICDCMSVHVLLVVSDITYIYHSHHNEIVLYLYHQISNRCHKNTFQKQLSKTCSQKIPKETKGLHVIKQSLIFNSKIATKLLQQNL